MWTVSELRSKVEELEATGVEPASEVEDGAETEDSENLEQFRKFLNLIDVVEMVGDDVADAILENFRYDDDQLELASNLISSGDYSVYDDAEAYGREIVDCCHTLDADLANYFDFEQFGQDALSGVSYTETDDGMIIIFG